jgi:hypothetical protein
MVDHKWVKINSNTSCKRMLRYNTIRYSFIEERSKKSSLNLSQCVLMGCPTGSMHNSSPNWFNVKISDLKHCSQNFNSFCCCNLLWMRNKLLSSLLFLHHYPTTGRSTNKNDHILYHHYFLLFLYQKEMQQQVKLWNNLLSAQTKLSYEVLNSVNANDYYIILHQLLDQQHSDGNLMGRCNQPNIRLNKSVTENWIYKLLTAA